MVKKQDGITLVALVITIIVLIILAGVTITLLLDENGILTNAKKGGENYTQAQGEEEGQIDNASKFINNIITPPYNP